MAAPAPLQETCSSQVAHFCSQPEAVVSSKPLHRALDGLLAHAVGDPGRAKRGERLRRRTSPAARSISRCPTSVVDEAARERMLGEPGRREVEFAPEQKMLKTRAERSRLS